MELVAENNSRDRVLALVFSIATFILLFLFFIFFLFKTPIPPYPPSVIQEVVIDFEGGSGDDGAAGVSTPDKTAMNQVKTQTSQSDNPFVSDVEEANINLKKNKKPDKKQHKEEVQVKQQEDPKPSKELLDLEASIKDKLRPVNNGSAEAGDGTGNAVAGDGHGKGTTPGPGTGTGDPGPGGGKGHYSLKGRKLLQRPQLLDNSQEEGTVVVDIIVDETGRVIDAIPGQRGSTTTSSYLYTLARQAAKTAKFNPSPDGTKEQKGTYTFVFRLQ